MTLLELLAATAGAGIIASQLGGLAPIRSHHIVLVMIMIVVAVGTMNVFGDRILALF
jgi:hypothetical protein